MIHSYHAAATVDVGVHDEATVLGLTLNLDTILGTVVASVILLAVGFFVRAKVTSGVPNGVQLGFETVVGLVRQQVEDFIGVKVAPFLVPLAMAVFLFLLACNWISVLPLHHYMPPPTADINTVLAMVALLLVWWYIAGFRRHGIGHVGHVVRGHYAPFAPLWIIQEIVHPVSLGLRLFGNILAGGIMVSVLGLLPAYVSWLPIAGWKIFDMGIGLLQAYLFMVLTIVYFWESMENREEAH